MKYLIIYSSKYGATQAYAEMIADQLKGDSQSQNVADVTLENLQAADKIILGSSIYMGSIGKSMQKFCVKYEELLLAKPLDLFINGLRSGDELADELAKAYTEKLRHHASQQAAFGGKVNFSKLTFMDKKIMKMVSKQEPQFETFDNSTNLSLLNEAELIRFAQQI
ncbi:flavodoxin domain-containing protein [Vagococcus sp. BWB3-3]|uniref:Flavodoxin domain-containing protein n=1 Tax=Vagococcus allomyrinae TaxID=2794353 RepID=A0A940P9J1_9ENTE|nr:flavodoxin domain-containing protein [Vagococcus allomyrinae]MBP1040944.1 flavodoxin domain-containing protein [Vagococcus allomyrinae]